MLMQFFLAIFEADGHISGPFGAPKEVEVIAETLALIESRHGAKEPVLPFKRDWGVLERRRFLARRSRLPAKCARRLSLALALCRRSLAQKKQLRFSKLEIFAQRDRERCYFFQHLRFFDGPGQPARDNDQHDRCGDKSHAFNETGSHAACQYASYETHVSDSFACSPSRLDFRRDRCSL